eukprot:COSAG02_NODE_27526_length_607_cov_1.596457_1_plen_131_part_00
MYADVYATRCHICARTTVFRPTANGPRISRNARIPVVFERSSQHPQQSQNNAIFMSNLQENAAARDQRGTLYLSVRIPYSKRFQQLNSESDPHPCAGSLRTALTEQLDIIQSPKGKPILATFSKYGRLDA